MICLTVSYRVIGCQPGLLSKDLHGSRPKSDFVVVGKQDIGPAGTFKDSVRRTTLAFDRPAYPEQLGQAFGALTDGQW